MKAYLTSKNDYELVQSALSGDRLAYDVLYNKSFLYAYNYIRKILYKDLISDDEIRDITHEVLLKCFNKLDTYEGKALFTTWVCSYAKYTVWNLNKKMSIRKKYKIYKTTSFINPLYFVIKKELKTATITALNSLSYLNYYLLTQHIFSKVSLTKISKTLKMPLKKVTSQYQVAIKDFITEFKNAYGCIPTEDQFFWEL